MTKIQRFLAALPPEDVDELARYAHEGRLLPSTSPYYERGGRL